jgi:tetratricopeptide (TPR) repeat protein
MPQDTFEEVLRELIAFNPNAQVKKTITVDPLVMDGLTLEQSQLKMAQFMENRDWDSEQEAKEFAQNIMPFIETGESAREIAEEIIIEAYEAPNKQIRISKAKKALQIFPQCAHAYLLLAMEENNLPQKIALLHEGIAAAEAILPPGIFLEFAGYVWARVDARPYMRCKTALALTLWESGDHEQAIDIMKGLLQINREDGQGLRFHLANKLLEFDPNDEYIRRPFFKDYKGDTAAFIQYAYALWLFHKQGPNRASTNALLRAIKHNKYVPVFLLERGQMPSGKLYRVERGSPEEAVSYCRIAASCWKKFAGSLDWLNANVGPISQKLIQAAESAKQCDLKGVTFAGMPLNISFE